MSVFLFDLPKLFFKGGSLANSDQTADTIQYAVHSCLALFFELLLLVGNLTVKYLAVNLLCLILSFDELKFCLGFRFGGNSFLLFHFGLLGFLFVCIPSSIDTEILK